MNTEIIINTHFYETRVAILEDSKLVELFTERKDQELLVGNIYKGLVKDVLPGMGAAFIDIGLNRTAFLHYKDINPNFLPDKKRRIRLRYDSSHIRKVIAPGQEIIVQVKKDPLGKKGARVTGKISIPGKFLVYIPKETKIALSRKIASSEEKNRIKRILSNIKEKETGLIVRTDTEGIDEDDFKQEYNGLAKTWKFLTKQIKHAKAPYCIFDENDLSYTLIRDLFNSSIDRLIIDDKKIRRKIISNLKDVSPDLINRIELYQEDSPIFDAYGIEKEIENIFKSRIKLPSGGNITIQQTEALVAIDVNTGSFTGKTTYDETIRTTNLEAALEAARQIRLRDLSGIMVVDFIDMSNEADQEAVFLALRNSLKRDRAKNKVYPFSPLGLIEISRKRTRPSLLLTYSEQCSCCNGTGRLLSHDSVGVKVSRWLLRAKYFIRNDPLKIVVHQDVKAFFEENPEVLEGFGNKLEIIADKKLKTGEFKIYSLRTNKELTAQYSS